MRNSQQTVRGRTLRNRLTAMLAGVGVLGMSLGLVAVTASSASAHTPSFTADCSGVTAAGTGYEAQDVNTLTVTLDGGAPQTKTFDVADSLTVPVPQDGQVHTWTASMITNNIDPSFSKTASGTVGPCGARTKVAVPQPKLNPPTCQTDGSVEWTPFANGTWTAITGTGVGPQSATPVANDGYELLNPGQVTVEVLGKDSLDCRSIVTAVPVPVVVASAACEVPGTVTLTSVNGVKYTWIKGAAGMTEGDYEIKATPEDGFTFEGAQDKVFTGTLAPAKDCATPVAPSLNQSSECDVPGRVSTVPAPGVLYTWELGAADMTEGPYRIVATPLAGHAFEGADQSVVYEGTLNPAGECSTAPPTVTGTKDTKGIKSTPMPYTQPPVTGTEQSVPTVVAAGLTGEDSGRPFDLATLMAQFLLAGGLMLLAAAGWTGLARREQGDNQA